MTVAPSLTGGPDGYHRTDTSNRHVTLNNQQVPSPVPGGMLIAIQ
ncbi:hypothetical protein [Pelovirga terrestris]|nr:hypothetical protein [Pelovirga terrestris]